MASVDEVLRRLKADPSFRAALDRDPASALSEYKLTSKDLARVEDAIRAGTGETVTAGAKGTSMALAGGRSWMMPVGLAGAVSAAIGTFLGATGAVADPRPTFLAPRQEVAATTCPTKGDPGSPAATFGTGDRVFVVGRDVDGERLAVRNPVDLAGLPVWVPAKVLSPKGDIKNLPVTVCGESAGPVDPSSNEVAADTTVSQPGQTSSLPSTVAPSTSSVVDPSATTSTSPSPTTPTQSTAPPDRIGPTLTFTADRSSMHTDGSPVLACRDVTTDLTAKASDPSGASIISVTWAYQTPGRPAQSGNASKLGGGRFRIGPFFGPNAPLSGSTPVTITATGRDGAGNTTRQNRVVTLTAYGDDCIG